MRRGGLVEHRPDRVEQARPGERLVEQRTSSSLHFAGDVNIAVVAGHVEHLTAGRLVVRVAASVRPSICGMTMSVSSISSWLMRSAVSRADGPFAASTIV